MAPTSSTRLAFLLCCSLGALCILFHFATFPGQTQSHSQHHSHSFLSDGEREAIAGNAHKLSRGVVNGDVDENTSERKTTAKDPRENVALSSSNTYSSSASRHDSDFAPSRTAAFHPSVDPPPNRLSPPVEIPSYGVSLRSASSFIASLFGGRGRWRRAGDAAAKNFGSEQRWAADYRAGVTVARLLTPNLAAIVRPFGGQEAWAMLRKDEGARRQHPELPDVLTNGQLLMAELYHVWRQSQFAIEVSACVQQVNEKHIDMEKAMEQSARVLSAALEAISKERVTNTTGRSSSSTLDSDTARRHPFIDDYDFHERASAAFDRLFKHPLLSDLDHIGALYDDVAEKATSFHHRLKVVGGTKLPPAEGQADIFVGSEAYFDSRPLDDVASDAYCVQRVVAHSPVFRTGRESRDDDAEKERVDFSSLHYTPLFTRAFSKFDFTCVAPGTGQIITNGERREGSYGAPVSEWWGPSIALAARRLADGGYSVIGDRDYEAPPLRSQPVSCYYTTHEDGLTVTANHVRALLRAPNLFILTQCVAHSAFGWKVCDASDRAYSFYADHGGRSANAKKEQQTLLLLPTPRLCLRPLPYPLDGFTRHPRILLVPHLDNDLVGTTAATARRNALDFVSRFGGDEGVVDAFLAQKENRGFSSELVGFVVGGSSRKKTSFLTQDAELSAATPVRLSYRSAPTGMSPMDFIIREANRDSAVVRQRWMNWKLLSELRYFLLPASPSSAATAFPSYEAIVPVAHQLMRQIYHADRLMLVSAMNNVDMMSGRSYSQSRRRGDNASDSSSPALSSSSSSSQPPYQYLFQHLLALMNKRMASFPSKTFERTAVDCSACASGKEAAAFFNPAQNSRQLIADVRHSKHYERPKPLVFERVGAPTDAANNATITEPISSADLVKLTVSYKHRRSMNQRTQSCLSDFMIDVDGNTNAFTNLMIKLCFGKPVFKVASSGRYAQWYYRHMVNGKHLFVLPADDIASGVGEWLSNVTVEEAATVGLRGRAFCEEFLIAKGRWRKEFEDLVFDPWRAAEENRHVPIRIQGDTFSSRPEF